MCAPAGTSGYLVHYSSDREEALGDVAKVQDRGEEAVLHIQRRFGTDDSITKQSGEDGDDDAREHEENVQ